MTAPSPAAGTKRTILTLRRFLVLAVAVGMGYVGVIGLLLAVRIAPGARVLRHDSELLLVEHDLISTRLAEQRRTVAEVRLMIEGGGSPDAAAALMNAVRNRLDSVLAIDAAKRSRLPDDVRLALARATEGETRLGERLLQSLAALQVGNRERSRQRLAAADAAALATESDLAAAQHLALADMVRREDQLTGMALDAARSVLVWLVAGSVGVLLGALFMRRRFFDPLRELEAGLSRVAAGDLSVSLPTRHSDEIGRLSGHLNMMTEVLRSAGREEVARRERLRSALTRLWTDQSGAVIGGDLHQSLAAVTSLAGPALDVERCSVWLYDQSQPAFRCEDLYQRGLDRHSRGEMLIAASHPAYFEAIAAGRVVVAEDALQDQRTRTFADSYLRPLGISSVLDAGISVRGRLAGLISFEQVGPARRWTEDEQAFASSMADYVSLILEAAERAWAEQALRRSEERYRAAFEQAAVGFVETDLDGVMLQVNSRFCSLLGYGEADLVGKSFSIHSHPDQSDIALAIKRLAGDEISYHEAEQRFRRRDGGIVWARVTLAPVRAATGRPQFLVAVVENVTERRNLETQLVRAQKMESIGRLAGGVAHDFNNLLTAIIGYAEAARGASSDPEIGSDLDEVLRAAGRGAELTRQLLTFARNHVVEPRVLDANDLVRGMDKLLRRLIGEHIELRTELAEALGAIRADPTQLEQVIVNLVVNARDAMPAGGRLVIETSRLVVRDDSLMPRRLDAPPGNYLQIAVSDTGVGMDESVLSRLFEPFFTTKPPDKGTGLGLAICYGIIKQAGGFIAVYSEPALGSTFRVCLPEVDARPAAAAGADTDHADTRGDETVLLAEDDAQIRRLGARALRAQGYHVIEAADGEQAVERAAGQKGPIHLLVTDVVLPRMSGPELSTRIRSKLPAIRVIFISGYTRGAMGQIAGEADHRFLPKPFTPRQLVKLVRETLDAGA